MIGGSRIRWHHSKAGPRLDPTIKPRKSWLVLFGMPHHPLGGRVCHSLAFLGMPFAHASVVLLIGPIGWFSDMSSALQAGAARARRLAMPSAPREPELRAAIRSCASAFLGVGLFSCVSNILMFTGSFFMLRVYDRVLPSQSVPTLVACRAPGGWTVHRTGRPGASSAARMLTRVGTTLKDAGWRDRVFDADRDTTRRPDAQPRNDPGPCAISTPYVRSCRARGRLRCSTYPGFRSISSLLPRSIALRVLSL